MILWLWVYLLIGLLWAEMGRHGHEEKYKKEVSGSFYVFMLLAWPWCLLTLVMDSFYDIGGPDGHV